MSNHPSASSISKKDLLALILQSLRAEGGIAGLDRLFVEACDRYPQLRSSSAEGLSDFLCGYPNLLTPLEGSDGRSWQILSQGEACLDNPDGSIPDGNWDFPNIKSTNFHSDAKPYDPQKINVQIKALTLYQVRRRLERGQIELQPDFQRNFVWDAVRQSRLIESMLIRIPLPAFFLDATRDDKWVVIDGLQRLTTIQNFCQPKTEDDRLRLRDLEFLPELNRKTFSELTQKYQQRLDDDTELTLYLLQPGSPPEAKFTIFSRVNTGGVVLTPQEIRHAVYGPKANDFVDTLARDQEFLDTTEHGISSKRMDDRECVLRFLAFYLKPFTQYSEPMDGFLNRTMEMIEEKEKPELDRLHGVFRKAMTKSRLVFGTYAFRKISANGKRGPINKTLVETFGICLLDYKDSTLEKHKTKIQEHFMSSLGSNLEYYKSISNFTGNKGAVLTRFETTKQLLKEACGEPDVK